MCPLIYARGICKWLCFALFYWETYHWLPVSVKWAWSMWLWLTCIKTKTKHNKVRNVCIFLGMYCNFLFSKMESGGVMWLFCNGSVACVSFSSTTCKWLSSPKPSRCFQCTLILHLQTSWRPLQPEIGRVRALSFKSIWLLTIIRQAYESRQNRCRTVYPKKYAHGFVVLCFVVVIQSFIMNSHEVFIHIHQGCFAGTGAIVRLPQCQWSKPDGYGKISQCITTTKHSKAKTVCIFLGIYCTWSSISQILTTVLPGNCCDRNCSTETHFKLKSRSPIN